MKFTKVDITSSLLDRVFLEGKNKENQVMKYMRSSEIAVLILNISSIGVWLEMEDTDEEKMKMIGI